MALPSTVHAVRVGNVSLRLHLSLLLGLPLFAFLVEHRMKVAEIISALGDTPIYAGPWTWGLLLAAGMLASVAGHEGAHALAARIAGARVEAITLAVFVGPSVAHSPIGPRREALVAVAGPLATLLLGGALYGASHLHHFLHLDAQFALTTFAEVQLVLGAVELLPAPPLDGGRILACALERRLPRPRATALVASTGRVSAALVAIGATLAGSALGLGLAAVIWAGSEAAARGALVEATLGAVRVGAVAGPPLCVDAAESLALLAAHMRRLRAPAWAVSEGGRLAGVVTAADVARIDPALREATRVGEVARTAPSVGLDSTASAALLAMRTAGVRVLPVVDAGRLVGLITNRALDAAGEIGELGAADEAVCEDAATSGALTACRLPED